MSRYMDWRAAHGGKRRYKTEKQAWRTILTIWVTERRIDWHLRPYVCTWTNDYTKGKTGPEHIHIGHRKPRMTLKKRWWFLYHRAFVWPYFRVRRHWRVLTQVKESPNLRSWTSSQRTTAYRGSMRYAPPARRSRLIPAWSMTASARKRSLSRGSTCPGSRSTSVRGRANGLPGPVRGVRQDRPGEGGKAPLSRLP